VKTPCFLDITVSLALSGDLGSVVQKQRLRQLGHWVVELAGQLTVRPADGYVSGSAVGLPAGGLAG